MAVSIANLQYLSDLKSQNLFLKYFLNLFVDPVFDYFLNIFKENACIHCKCIIFKFQKTKNSKL